MGKVYLVSELKKEFFNVFLEVKKTISSFGTDAFRRYSKNIQTLKIERDYQKTTAFPAGYDPEKNIITLRGNLGYINHELFHVAMDDRSKEYDNFFKKNTGFVEGFTEYFSRISNNNKYDSTAYPIPTLMANCLVFIYGFDKFDFLFKENNYNKLLSLAKEKEKLLNVIDSVNLYTELSLKLEGIILTPDINNHINGLLGYVFNSLFELGKTELNNKEQEDYLRLIKNCIKENDFKMMNRKNYKFVKETLNNEIKKR